MANIELYDKLKTNFRDKDIPEKFMVSNDLAYPENNERLAADNVFLTTPAQEIVLTLDPEALDAELKTAKSLGYLDAYQQNPKFLTHSVDESKDKGRQKEMISQRIAFCEAHGIPYKNEKGKYQRWLFSNRGYAYMIKDKSEVQVAAVDSSMEAPSVNAEEIKEYADRVIETFALDSEREVVYNKIVSVLNSGMTPKEILMQAFGEYADNLDYLSTSIDEIMNVEEKMGRVA